MQIFAIDNNIPLLYAILQQDANNIIHTFDNGAITNAELIKNKTEFLIVRSTIKANASLLRNTAVKFVATATTGTEHIDIAALEQNNIGFFAAIGANSNSVAEYIIFSILFAFKNCFDELKNKTIGIVGYGNIGSKVAYYLDKMGINHIICDPIKAKTNKNADIIFHNMDYLFENADIITFHTPLTTTGEHKTLNLLNENNINKIKNGSIVINSARGGVCNENSLINNRSRLNFIIDVWENEPNIANKDLINTALIATPHIAGHSYNGKLNATIMICEELNRKYGFDLDYSTFNINFNANMLNKVTDMTDFMALFEVLSINRELISLSNSFKSHISGDISTFFVNTRKNYPQYFETLHLI